ncbi:MAG: hypothetical protein RBJ76_11820 [Stenomitos frigidus ULC029]
MNSFLIVQAKCTRYRAVKVLHTIAVTKCLTAIARTHDRSIK